MKMRINWLWNTGLLTIMFLFAVSMYVSADDFDDYDSCEIRHIVLPEVEGGWFTAVDIFSDCDETIGSFNVKGRILAINHQSVYLQKNYGAGCHVGDWDYDTNPTGAPAGGHDNFITVATLDLGTGSMDPSFVKISPDGKTIAIGAGYGQPLYVFPTSLLDSETPPVLNDGSHPEVKSYTVNYYDAEWVDENGVVGDYRLAISSGVAYVPGGGVEVLDTTRPISETTPVNPVPIVEGVNGASADVTFDFNGNMITGNSWCYGGEPDNTGQIKIFSKNDWEAVYALAENESYISYEPWTKLIASNILSAAAMGVDKENNLHVGGGNWLGGTAEQGFSAIVEQSVLTRVLAGGEPTNEGDPLEYKQLAPDPLANDSSTSPVEYNFFGEGLSIAWNPHPTETYWMVGTKAILTTYYGSTPPDTDSDGVPDGSDNAHTVFNEHQWDTDEDGWGNAWDCDYDQSEMVNFTDYTALMSQLWGTEPLYDHNEDGNVNFTDYTVMVSNLWAPPGE